MRITSSAQHDAWQAGHPPPVEQVRTGLWSVPVPIPNSPLRYTLSYLFTGEHDLVVVDPGWDSEAGWAALTGGLQAAGASVTDVTGIVVTHVHADHHGLSTRLREASGAWVAMHPEERDSLPTRIWDRTKDEPDSNEAWLTRCGVPPDVAAEMQFSRATLAPFFAMAEPDVLLDHGDLVPLKDARVRAIWTPGHTPGHLCLHDAAAGLLLTGDHLLPRISPNIGVHDDDGSDPLSDYLASLEQTAKFTGEEALPAHEYRFRGIDARAADLIAHHDERGHEILTVLDTRGASTGWAIASALTWSRGWDALRGMLRRMALGETLAHLRYLAATGAVRSNGGDPKLWRH